LIVDDGLLDQGDWERQRPKISELLDLEYEEQRDIEAVRACMKKHSRLWKNLFSKYANTGFTTKQQQSFDQIGVKTHTINYPEATKLFKDHSMLPTYISKEEVQQLVRLINLKEGKKEETYMVDYPGYLNLI